MGCWVLGRPGRRVVVRVLVRDDRGIEARDLLRFLRRAGGKPGEVAKNGIRASSPIWMTGGRAAGSSKAPSRQLDAVGVLIGQRRAAFGRKSRGAPRWSSGNACGPARPGRPWAVASGAK